MHIICKGVKFCENPECIHELYHTFEVTLKTTLGIASTIITLLTFVNTEPSNSQFKSKHKQKLTRPNIQNKKKLVLTWVFWGSSLHIMNTFTMESIHDLCGRHTHAVIASRSRLLGIGKV